MYAAMGAPYAGFGTSIMVDDAIPSAGASPGPASAAPPPPSPTTPPPSPNQTGNGMQSGTEREVPLHLQAQVAPQAYAMQNGAGGGLPWPWLVAGVGVTIAALWYFQRRSRAG